MEDGSMWPRKSLFLTIPIAVACLVLGACSTAGPSKTTITPAAAQAGRTDINPHDRTTLRTGGELRIAVTQLPDNWNYNEVDGPTGVGYEMLSTLLPVLWEQQADGTVRSNPDYLTSVQLTSQNPQVVTYRINPKAHWSDGTPLSWRDIAAQADALSGQHKDFLVATTAGYDDVASVVRGANDQEARITFKSPYADWRNMFSPLYPAEISASAAEFNTGWLSAPKMTAGPFLVQSIDTKNMTATVARDPKWWGTKPLLDRITFKVIPKAQLVSSFTANQIDFFDIVSDTALAQRSRQLPDAVVRQAPATDYSALVFGATQNPALADARVRVALQKAIDTRTLVKQVLGQLERNPQPLGNHLLLASASDYHDNSALAGYDPQAAGRTLDELGWQRSGQYRTKGGQTLALRFVIAGGIPTNAQIASIVQTQLARIGVRVDVVAVPSSTYFKDYVNVGKYDLATFRWGVNSFPLSAARSMFYLDPDNIDENYGRIGSPALNALLNQAAGELNPGRLAVLEQQIDQEVWRTGSMLPLFQTSGAVTERADVANFGAAGYANIPFDWVNVGFTH
jgi:peptide/nickel transport system substrate-binding protein